LRRRRRPRRQAQASLTDKVDQVWLFTSVFSVPWTNNCSERALKSPKLHLTALLMIFVWFSRFG
jgi:hypothetical protein